MSKFTLNKGMLSPRKAPAKPPLDTALQFATQPTEPYEPPLDLEQALGIIASQAERIATQALIIHYYQDEEQWQEALSANPEVTPIQKQILTVLRKNERKQKPTLFKEKLLWCLNLAPIAKEAGVSPSSISRQIHRLADNKILDIEEEEEHVRKDGSVIPLLIWGKTMPIVETPELITFSTPNGAGGARPNHCECGGAIKVSQRVNTAQDIARCKKCRKVKIYPSISVNSVLPETSDVAMVPADADVVSESEQLPEEPALQFATSTITSHGTLANCKAEPTIAPERTTLFLAEEAKPETADPPDEYEGPYPPPERATFCCRVGWRWNGEEYVCAYCQGKPEKRRRKVAQWLAVPIAAVMP